MTQKNDWDINPDSYVTGPTGNFVLKLDGTPRKKAGKKLGQKNTLSYNISREVRAKQAAKRRLAEAKQEEKKVRARNNTIQARKRRAKEDIDILEGRAKSNIIDEETAAPTMLDAPVIFKANEGPQEDFLAASEKDVLYGGAAGGGKSYAMIVDPLRYAHKAAHRALILRRTTGELGELIDKTRELYPKAFKGATWKEAKSMWVFPSGAQIQFGFLERDSDVYRYQGRAYSWIGFDEITQMATEFAWNYLASRLRSTDPTITCYLRCTANPGGIGAHWVKKRYITPSPPNETFIGGDEMERRFIPARLTDNPYLTQDGQYEAMLKTLPPVLRQQLLNGDWDVSEGAAFTEFDVLKHVIPPMEIPNHWARIKGIDYGYASESAVVWGAIDPTDGTLIIYRELYKKNLLASQLGRVITEMEIDEHMSIQGILDTACWSRTGTDGPTTAQAIMQAGHKVRQASKARKPGKLQIHEYLKVQPNGRPRIQMFNTCPNLIRELQTIPISKKDPEDVDTHAPDHAYDALRYLIMSRPPTVDRREQFRQYHRNQHTPSDSTFGY
jgi:hypothetical protein